MAGVMGIDPSLTGTGIAHWAPGEGWYRHTIVSKGHNTDTYADTSKRLDRLVERVEAERAARDPDLVVVESPAFSSMSGHASDRAGLFWLIVKAMEKHWPDVAVAFCPPNVRIRYGLGKGSGSKDAVLAAAIKQFPDADIRNNNEADAVLLAAMGSVWLAGQPGFPETLGLVDKPNAQRADAIKRVQWPLSLSA